MQNNKVARAIARSRAVAALGLVTEETTQFEVDLLFSLILNDPIVNECALGYGFEVDEETGRDTAVMAVTFDDYVEIIEKMSPQEKQELRKRIGR